MTPNPNAGVRRGLMLGLLLTVTGTPVAAQPELPVARGRLFSLQRSQDDIHEWGQAR